MFGRRCVIDLRDEEYPFRRASSKRTSHYWQSRYHGDQGDDPYCVGFAWAHWLEANPLCQQLPGDGIYRLAKYLDNWNGENYEGTSVRAGAKVLGILKYIREYRWATTVTPVVNTILAVGPVVCGVDWHEGMMSPDAKGVIHATGEVVGGHAVLLDGVSKPRRMVRVKNSWGTNWGRNGRAWLSFADLHDLLGSLGEACLGVERKPR